MKLAILEIREGQRRVVIGMLRGCLKNTWATVARAFCPLPLTDKLF